MISRKLEISMDAKIYNIQGKETGIIQLPESLFCLPWNADLVHQVVTSMQSNERTPIAHTKDRGEVRGGGRKPWKQKGTGRARHGSTRSPIWKGGGVTHGPRNEKSYTKKINQQMRQKALLVVLSRKWKDGEVLFVDSIMTDAPKTKVAKGMLDGLVKSGMHMPKNKSKNTALIALPKAHAATQKSFANFRNIEMIEVRNLNPVVVLSSKYLIIANPAAAIEMLSKKKVAKDKPLDKTRSK